MSSDIRLIERWLPIAALGEESVRERRSMTSLPPTYYLHVWWARRPLVASRAAVLPSLMPGDWTMMVCCTFWVSTVTQFRPGDALIWHGDGARGLRGKHSAIPERSSIGLILLIRNGLRLRCR